VAGRLNGTTRIDNNDVPNTVKRTLSSEIAVRDKDTIMLGGFIRSNKQKSKSGIPILQDIPLLGALFSSRTSAKDREELIVLMRPTVLKTPEIAAKNTIAEEQRLPGISAASAENDAAEAKFIEAERKAALKRAKIRQQTQQKQQAQQLQEDTGFFTPVEPVPVPPPAMVETNIAIPLP